MSDPQITIKGFDGLSLRELHACYKLRGEVFVLGQKICDEADVDAYDPLCHHVMVWLDEELVGTARLLPIEDRRAIKVGRVAVGEPFRGQGFGVALMRAAQDWIDALPGRTGVMSAQAYLEKWYAALGWQAVGGVYQEAGIDHIKMVWGQ